MIAWLKSFRSRKARIQYLIEKHLPGHHLHTDPVRKKGFPEGIIVSHQNKEETYGKKSGEV